MMEAEGQALLIKVFLRLRRMGLGLGVRELLDALRALKGGWGRGEPEELRQMARLLWCSSPDSARDLDDAWEAVISESKAPAAQPPRPRGLPPSSREEAEEPKVELATALAPSQVADAPEQELSALPVQAPFTPVSLDESMQFDTYWPVTRRSMSYTWRYLRRMVADGPADVLDIDSTVERACRQGFYLAPVYKRRQRNHAHLILLLDQGGSMVPFHRFTRDVSETAARASAITEVEVYYFHNVVADELFRDPYLTEPVRWESALARCDGETSVLIVSDAGAARGFRRLSRIRASAEFLARLRGRTTLFAWLNPMPDARWPDTSAAAISQFVKMYQMDPDGFSSAIDLVRGQQV